MINNWYVTGDTHGVFSRFKNLQDETKKDSNMGMIILGDAGFNFFMDIRDNHIKNKIDKKYNFSIYCIRGNHEERPELVPGMELIYDENVGGIVYYEPQFPKIKYFPSWGIYTFNGKKALILGGAYSVDKTWRIQNGYHWFQGEQMTYQEMEECMETVRGMHFDFVLSHTCPLSWQPTDMFLGFVNQSTVDNSMERWMEQLKDMITFDTWLFGHYHGDRIELPKVEMMSENMDTLNNISARWDRYAKTGEIDWYLSKGPKWFYEQENSNE